MGEKCGAIGNILRRVWELGGNPLQTGWENSGSNLRIAKQIPLLNPNPSPKNQKEKN
jgi:hypothetical protein